jgi:hypothetical protein
MVSYVQITSEPCQITSLTGSSPFVIGTLSGFNFNLINRNVSKLFSHGKTINALRISNVEKIEYEDIEYQGLKIVKYFPNYLLRSVDFKLTQILENGSIRIWSSVFLDKNIVLLVSFNDPSFNIETQKNKEKIEFIL